MSLKKGVMQELSNEQNRSSALRRAVDEIGTYATTEHSQT
jgi:hypothetical protein